MVSKDKTHGKREKIELRSRERAVKTVEEERGDGTDDESVEHGLIRRICKEPLGSYEGELDP